MRSALPRSFVSILCISLTAFTASLTQAQQGGWQQPQSQVPNPNQIIARGLGGVLTVDGVNAYIEALEFSLTQVGQPTRFDPNMRIQIAQGLVQMFPMADLEVQTNLAQARIIWTQHAQSWSLLSFPQKQEFVYDVLSLYVGEQVAANAVGLNTGGGNQGASQGATGDGYVPNPLNDSYDGESCWAAAGCVDYDADSDSYTYEDYDSSTDSYEPQ
jgi:hypothetical protein|tara:strand:+ start:2430 stop:3074 length:645 start_codon:yes stop_codon:yes gene_type:complete